MSTHPEAATMEQNKKYVFSFETTELERIYDECCDQTRIVHGLLEQYYQSENNDKEYLCLLCESYSINWKVKEQLEYWFDDMPFSSKDGKEILMVNQTEAILLETAVAAKDQVKKELSRHYNISSTYN
tara:strand:+ start:80 stop:463 length:384 start_codon:yes stop_codon:yes gene_type:complete